MDDLVFKELLSRDRSRKKFDLEDYLFDKQLAFVRDPAPFATAVCSRRAGKTVACAWDMIDTCHRIEGAVCLYITLTRDNAKKIVWKELKEINRSLGLGAKINETELSMYFPTWKSTIYLSGAKDKSEIEKFRGLALALCYIDECQSFRAHIQELVDDVISKALFDFDGRLRLTGTPGPVPVGYFHSCATSAEWSNHKWTMFDNPWLERKSGKTALELMQRDLKRKGVSINDPSIRRECYGEWTVDLNALVVRWADDNHFDEVPILTHYVLGVDIGHDDADAIAVIGWNEKSPKAYLVEEFLKKGQTVTELADAIERFINIFNPVKVVMDTGGLGKKIAEELRRRRSLPVVAAEKARKFEFIELMNDALRTGNLMAKRTSQFAEDSALLEWDKDAKLDKPKVKDTFHSDIIDAVLYAYREAMHWLYRPEEPKIKLKSKEYWDKQVADMEEAARNGIKKENDELEGFIPLDPFSKWPI